MKKEIIAGIAALCCGVLASCADTPESLARQQFDLFKEYAASQKGGRLDSTTEARFEAKSRELALKVEELSAAQKQVLRAEITRLCSEDMKLAK
ncbi:MAG: hypothetical protein LBU90_04315 [Bacteroidales bacterium]|jgi:hypothetical protein|nr:hypothetical protein [Bacteroidales bacterium]